MPTDPRVRAILDDFIPNREVFRPHLVGCTSCPAAPHIPVISYGVKDQSSVGKVFGVCTKLNGQKCTSHMKPAKAQLSDADMQEVHARIAALDPPAKLGGIVYFGARSLSQRGRRSAARKAKEPPTETTMVDAWVYIKDGDMPITIPLLCTVLSEHWLSVNFRQPISCDVLGFKLDDDGEIPFEHFDARLGRFVAYPPAHERRYFLRREVLVYRHQDVLHCPGVVRLADIRRPFLDPPPLPSLLDHLRSYSPDDVQSSQTLASSPPLSPAASEWSLPSDGLQIDYSSPGRVLTSGRTDFQASSSPAPSGPGPSSAASTSVGRKRKREPESNVSRKRLAGDAGKGKAREVVETDVEGLGDYAWEMLKDGILLRY
ncbi:hypothetical protein EVJ58_g10554 [Rhodofomes roseus]|uniref:Uncharacterized protein n=1 Tax=Rhodofomes roseus TaxID=34475 RepID=A0A4Y9XMD9_9APHY|nr:hypothetical protein EVJ58_g10554 [Rhodofomes roseus]